jgi:hypothetical protein
MSRFKVGDWVVVTKYADGEEKWITENNPKRCYKIGQSFKIKSIAGWGVVWGSKESGKFEDCLELKAIYNTPLYKAMREEDEQQT